MRHKNKILSPRTYKLGLMLGLNLFALALTLALPSVVSAATVTVTSTADSGAGSLRQAILDAASNDTIVFSLPANSTITLTSAELTLTKNVTINGPGANLLTIRRSSDAGTPQFRIFHVFFGNLIVNFYGLTIANGNAPGQGQGGGIFHNGATMTITNCTIADNRTNSDISTGIGGGILNNGTMTISGSTISGNHAGSFGGGIHNFSTLTITNSTISGNSTVTGGGIYNAAGALTVINSTIAENRAIGTQGAGHGGGVLRNGGTFNAKNTILAKNTATVATTHDLSGGLNSQGYNLIGSVNPVVITGDTTGNQLNVDPMLSALQDNGGQTFTYALLTGSPAIDKGNSSGSIYDQRRLLRPVSDPDIPDVSDGSDIGAYEVQWDQLPGCIAVNRVVGNTSDIGTGSLRTVINNVCAGTPITFAPNVTGEINLTSGELGITKTVTINGPGANLLTVRRSASAGNFRIFQIFTGAYNVSISGLTIANGRADVNGGGGIYSGAGIVRITNCIVSGNSGGTGPGGGIANVGASIIIINNSVISGNTASATSVSGGGIYNSGAGTVAIINSTVSGNIAGSQYGGGVYNTNTGELIVHNSSISGNTANSNGGGIYNANTGTVTITSSIFSGNNIGGNGGAISSNGTMTITDSTFSANTAAGGGGILNSGSGTMTITNSTLSGNSATSGLGGGIYNSAGMLTVTSSTISGNSAFEVNLGIGVGGGIVNSDSGMAYFISSTITGNNAQFRGGGIRNTSNSFVSALNTIIALNTSPTGPDVDGTLSSQGYNLIRNTSGASIINIFTGNQLNIDPMLGSLAYNGGTTRTHALLPNSPAIDKGFTSAVTVDQRGYTRPFDNPGISNPANGADIGAFERTPSFDNPPFDFDGDGKTDISIHRPSVGEWWYLNSSNGGNAAFQFGNSQDEITPGDFTGDGKSDVAFFRPSTGEWFVLRSEDSSYYSYPFGTSGDIPAVGDFDADGKADTAVFRSSDTNWYIRRSSDGGATIQQFGVSGDVPAVADYDGDGKADIAIWRPSLGQWWIQRSTAGTIAFTFGNNADKPVQGDYTGDGKADVAIFRPSGGEWFILRSEDFSYYSFPFGISTDLTAPGDYDGDGKFDAAIFRPSDSIWYISRSTAGTLIQQFGQNGDRPVPNAFVP